MLSDCVQSYFPEFHRVALAMISAQGGIFGWVTPSIHLLEALQAEALQSVPESAAEPVPAIS